MQAGQHAPAARRGLLLALLAARPSLAAEERAWLAQALCELCPAAQDEIGGLEALRERGGRRGFAWLSDNEPYLYWQASQRRFRVDREARAAATPSEEYRRAHPWPDGAGPARR